ncbi:hypothetical protein ACIQJX_35150 [Streptomyces griseoviridis]
MLTLRLLLGFALLVLAWWLFAAVVETRPVVRLRWALAAGISAAALYLPRTVPRAVRPDLEETPDAVTPSRGGG